MRIIVADDSQLARLTLTRHFEDLPGLEVVEATNGVDVLEYHRTWSPDVIFLDITMPVLNGVATLKIIRMLDKKVRIAIVSSVGDQLHYREECLRMGADYVLAKPIDKEIAQAVIFGEEVKQKPKPKSKHAGAGGE